MVEHCDGPKTDGNFVRPLTLTDIATGWTECVEMRVRNQMLALKDWTKRWPICHSHWLGVDSDNDSAFMNQSVFDYCKRRGLVQTHSRAYSHPVRVSGVSEPETCTDPSNTPSVMGSGGSR